MAVFSLADFTTAPSAMPTQMRELINCVQRLVPFVRTVAWQNGVTGNNINYDVKLGGKTAGNVSLDGGNLLTATADVRRQVSLAYGEYGAAMQITDKLRRSVGAVQGHEFLKNLAQQDLLESITATCKVINQQAYSGTGSSQQMTGLSTAVAASGAYGGLTDSTYWISQVSENGGSLRSTTLPIIRTHLSNHAKQTGNTFGRPDLAFCTPAIFDVVLGLFSVTTFVDPGNIVNANIINTASGKVTNTGYRSFTWGSEQLTFIEDPDVTHSGSTNATSGIYFISSSAVAMEQLPPAEMAMTDAQTMAAAMEQFGPIAGLQFEIQPRGRTKAATEWDVTAMAGLKVKCRAATSWLGDLQ